MNNIAKGSLFAASAAFCWAIAIVLSKAQLGSNQFLTVLGWQMLFSTIFSWALVFFRNIPFPSPKTALKLSRAGLLQFGLYYILVFAGLKLVTVNEETLISSTEGILMIPFGFYFLGEKPVKWATRLGFASLFGLGLAVWPNPSAPIAASPLEHGFGIALVFLSNFVGCFYTILTARDLKHKENWDVWLILALQQTPALILIWACLVVHRLYLPAQGISYAWPAGFPSLKMIAAGLLFFAVPFWLYLKSVRLQGAARTAQFIPLIPIFGILLSGLFLGERLSWVQWIGAGVVIGCAYWISRQPTAGVQ